MLNPKVPLPRSAPDAVAMILESQVVPRKVVMILVVETIRVLAVEKVAVPTVKRNLAVVLELKKSGAVM